MKGNSRLKKLQPENRKLNTSCYTKVTQDISKASDQEHRDLGSYSSSTLEWKELGSWDLKPQIPQGNDPRPLLALSHIPGSFSIHQVLR